MLGQGRQEARGLLLVGGADVLDALELEGDALDEDGHVLPGLLLQVGRRGQQRRHLLLLVQGRRQPAASTASCCSARGGAGGELEPSRGGGRGSGRALRGSGEEGGGRGGRRLLLQEERGRGRGGGRAVGLDQRLQRLVPVGQGGVGQGHDRHHQLPAALPVLPLALLLAARVRSEPPELVALHGEGSEAALGLDQQLLAVAALLSLADQRLLGLLPGDLRGLQLLGQATGLLLGRALLAGQADGLLLGEVELLLEVGDAVLLLQELVAELLLDDPDLLVLARDGLDGLALRGEVRGHVGELVVLQLQQGAGRLQLLVRLLQRRQLLGQRLAREIQLELLEVLALDGLLELEDLAVELADGVAQQRQVGDLRLLGLHLVAALLQLLRALAQVLADGLEVGAELLDARDQSVALHPQQLELLDLLGQAVGEVLADPQLLLGVQLLAVGQLLLVEALAAAGLLVVVLAHVREVLQVLAAQALHLLLVGLAQAAQLLLALAAQLGQAAAMVLLLHGLPGGQLLDLVGQVVLQLRLLLQADLVEVDVGAALRHLLLQPRQSLLRHQPRVLYLLLLPLQVVAVVVGVVHGQLQLLLRVTRRERGRGWEGERGEGRKEVDEELTSWSSRREFSWVFRDT